MGQAKDKEVMEADLQCWEVDRDVLTKHAASSIELQQAATIGRMHLCTQMYPMS